MGWAFIENYENSVDVDNDKLSNVITSAIINGDESTNIFFSLKI